VELPQHRLADEISIALHQAIAEELLRGPGLVERARERVEGWLREGSVSHWYAERWRDLLSLDTGSIAEAIVRRDEETTALRQVSPFAGVIDPRTRWRLRREVRARLER
jgi:hypothetical protein